MLVGSFKPPPETRMLVLHRPDGAEHVCVLFTSWLLVRLLLLEHLHQLLENLCRTQEVHPPVVRCRKGSDQKERDALLHLLRRSC